MLRAGSIFEGPGARNQAKPRGSKKLDRQDPSASPPSTVDTHTHTRRRAGQHCRRMTTAAMDPVILRHWSSPVAL
eukprot:466234-Pyramimonas_sp.AAC.1